MYIYIYMYIHTDIHIYIHIYKYIYTNVFIYTHIQKYARESSLQLSARALDETAAPEISSSIFEGSIYK
jgi:hypothetical protein